MCRFEMRAVLWVVALVLANACAQPEGIVQIDKFSLDSSSFSQDLYKTFRQQPGNLLFSPISIHTVLSMIYQGADGTTSDDLRKSLYLQSPESAAEHYRSIIIDLNNVQNVTLSTVNKIYLQTGLQLQDKFAQTIKDQFVSDIELINFEQSQKSAETINGWVQNQTNNKIKNLVKEEDFNKDSRLILINAIYFKGDWDLQFDKTKTKTEKFYKTLDDNVDVEMMHLTDVLLYKEDAKLDAQIIQLPYKNSDVSLIIVLPKSKDGITKLEDALVERNPIVLLDERNLFDQTRVSLSLPKFRLEKTIDLQDSLTQLGLGVIFDGGSANFSKIITSGENLVVSKAVQKAFLEVNEEGSEAAAATAIQFVLTSFNPAPPVNFIADHPFVFYIKKEYKILFQGRVSDIKK